MRIRKDRSCDQREKSTQYSKSQKDKMKDLLSGIFHGTSLFILKPLPDNIKKIDADNLKNSFPANSKCSLS